VPAGGAAGMSFSLFALGFAAFFAADVLAFIAVFRRARNVSRRRF